MSKGIPNKKQKYICPKCNRTRKDNGKWCLYCGYPREFESEQHKQQWEIEHGRGAARYLEDIQICRLCGKGRAGYDFDETGGLCRFCHWDKRWREHPEERREHYREYQRKRRAEDIDYRIGGNLRSRLYHAIKGKYKSTSLPDLLGCSVERLRDRLESQFTEGMTWENYGEWHIDHIAPMSIFDLTDEYQLKTVMNYKNLQPLWASDNIRKSNKHEGYVQLRMV